MASTFIAKVCLLFALSKLMVDFTKDTEVLKHRIESEFFGFFEGDFVF
ncbi:hypothetical protein LEP1GSC172_3773 [Leptospira noguchii]|uniref:Uncharacterized protein n=2 Tax=Leptospira noguchii TaxID=28182 RepID=T0FVK4_9LEPT|nr:hypothetical protein LEP1GSC172_3773 [Leptospira noguchii]EQA73580.1 hypothetical protein LEP1GSC059_2532 [Leptospira noguchii serovar Panama str. CZ214]